MKFKVLQSIAHNVADSLGSGDCMLIGVYDIDIYTDASRSRKGFIEVDFLTGKSSGAWPSWRLRRAIRSYKEGLRALCAKHGTTPDAFRALTARYSRDQIGKRMLVTIEDKQGRRSIKEYVGIPGRRIRVLDPLGRVRPK
jgi:hypothetical protein